jgi:hypothetical protein
MLLRFPVLLFCSSGSLYRFLVAQVPCTAIMRLRFPVLLCLGLGVLQCFEGLARGVGGVRGLYSSQCMGAFRFGCVWIKRPALINLYTWMQICIGKICTQGFGAELPQRPLAACCGLCSGDIAAVCVGTLGLEPYGLSRRGSCYSCVECPLRSSFASRVRRMSLWDPEGPHKGISFSPAIHQ